MGEAAGNVRSADPVIDVGHLLAQGESCLIILILLILSDGVGMAFGSTKDQHFLLRCVTHVSSFDAKAFYARQQLWACPQDGLSSSRKGYVKVIINNLEGAVTFLDNDKVHLRC